MLEAFTLELDFLIDELLILELFLLLLETLLELDFFDDELLILKLFLLPLEILLELDFLLDELFELELELLIETAGLSATTDVAVWLLLLLITT